MKNNLICPLKSSCLLTASYNNDPNSYFNKIKIHVLYIFMFAAELSNFAVAPFIPKLKNLETTGRQL